MQRSMILVCHAADGSFNDGNRSAIRGLLEQAAYIRQVDPLGRARVRITCTDGADLELYAPGLDGKRPFHRMEICLTNLTPTKDQLQLVLDLMRSGGFGLMENLNASKFIVTLPQQVVYFPWLPEPPMLVRNTRDLGHTISHL